MTGPDLSPSPATPPTGPSPAGPPRQEGLRAQARVKIGEAVRMLTEALSVLKEVKSEEGKAVVRALQTLGPVTPEVAEGISQAEIASMISGLQGVRPGMGGGPPPTMLGGPTPRPAVLSGAPLGR